MPDLTGFPAIDVAIGLAFLFFLLSTIAASINEGIAGILGKRAKNLEQAVARLLGDELKKKEKHDAGAGAAGEGDKAAAAGDLPHELMPLVFQHWRIKALAKDPHAPQKRNNTPSYIPARAFSRAVAEVIAWGGKLPAADPQSGEADSGAKNSDEDKEADKQTPWQKTDEQIGKAVQEVLGKLPAGSARGVLQRAAQIAQGDLERFRTEIEGAFDDTMARASGWYKRHTQFMLLIIAFVLTIGLNVDSLRVGDRLWKSPELRAAVVTKANAAGNTPQTVADRVNAVKQLSLPIGWGAENAPTTGKASEIAKHKHKTWYKIGQLALGVGRRIPGWLLTILALTLGAPFWFDLLSRLSRLRNTGVPEEPKTLSDRPVPPAGKPAQAPSDDAEKPGAAEQPGAGAPAPPLPAPDPSVVAAAVAAATAAHAATVAAAAPEGRVTTL